MTLNLQVPLLRVGHTGLRNPASSKARSNGPQKGNMEVASLMLPSPIFLGRGIRVMLMLQLFGFYALNLDPQTLDSEP